MADVTNGRQCGAGLTSQNVDVKFKYLAYMCVRVNFAHQNKYKTD